MCGRETSETTRVKSAEAIRAATCVVFLTRWTRSHHAQLERTNNFRLLRSWVDLARIDQFLAQNDSTELRRRHGIPEGKFVFVCMGSICDRKGQRAFIRAGQWLRQGGDRRPEQGGEFIILLVGARPTADTMRLAKEIETLGLDEVRLVAETPRAWEFLMLADAYVCPSFEEGFPRALMEASAMRKWIIATSIPGNREMLTETEAWMVLAGDPPAMARAMREVMKAAEARDFRRPDAARWKMERWFDDAQSLPVHAALAVEIAQQNSI
jgi:glycosyltransferase involved in cell wall biosynthesis